MFDKLKLSKIETPLNPFFQNQKIDHMKKLFFLVVFFTYNSANAQTPLFKVLADLEEVEKKTNYDFPKEKIGDNGGGYSLDPSMLAKPVQKIALLTFFLEDPGTALNGSLWRA